ncbi:MAG: STAS domain-containing protein [Alphaproteobacteria bacterium]|nr:STAS domain-containing protein [Alphaproteobacteria bacterium]MBQ3118073.1 STAS domain-containing protein [Alphaproteobacteria bacterium]MBQ6854569.1 STAS domain-containing protein [Alphaproteobacteria bacterium]MBR3913649.1 STAS domain-containing protein [Alphaproteobacteria bacterium]MBR4932050.1 STAS domain-containing protein [Alphaproteobacteria bacterium]
MNYRTKDTKEGKEIFFSGSFTFRDHDSFFEIVSLIKSAKVQKIIFDLSECEFIDSAALGMFVIAHDEASSQSVSLSIRGVQGKVKDVMYAARFDSLYVFE